MLAVRTIAEGTDIALATVHRYLLSLKKSGELEYNGRRSVSTRRMEMEQIAHAMPVLTYVACGEGQEETEQVIEYIRMPESLVDKGKFFSLIAKGESMVDAGIHCRKATYHISLARYITLIRKKLNYLENQKYTKSSIIAFRVTPERYDTMAGGYEQDQASLRGELQALNEQMTELDVREHYVNEFIAKAK